VVCDAESALPPLPEPAEANNQIVPCAGAQSYVAHHITPPPATTCRKPCWPARVWTSEELRVCLPPMPYRRIATISGVITLSRPKGLGTEGRMYGQRRIASWSPIWRGTQKRPNPTRRHFENVRRAS
jgi:hypothetical protein